MKHNRLTRFQLVLLVFTALTFLAQEQVGARNTWRATEDDLIYLPLLINPEIPGLTTLVSLSSDGLQGNSGAEAPSISANGRYVAFHSYADNLVEGDTNGVQDVFVHDRSTGQTTRVSVSTQGMQGNSHSDYPAISADGRFVAFHSYATNLVEQDTNVCYAGVGGYNCPDIFVHDRQTGETTRVSVATDGTQSNAPSFSPSISADGRFVVFSSYASNLVHGDTNSGCYLLDLTGNCPDIFVHDRRTGETTRISIASDGTESNSYSSDATISADGRFVAFSSHAANLVVGDTNDYPDVFVHDRLMGQTTRVSVASDGVQGDDVSGSPSISADGRFVAFDSGASNLIEDTNTGVGLGNVFVHDRETGETRGVSFASDGSAGAPYGSREPSISADGRFVAFVSEASNLVDGDTNDMVDIFVHDRQLGRTTLVSVASNGAQANWHSGNAAISGDGLYVAFVSEASNLVAGDTNDYCEWLWYHGNDCPDVFVHDRWPD